jgi:hypothetical protein
MKKIHKRLVASVIVLLLAVLGLGYFVPLGSYTANGCTAEVVEQRLHMIAGDTLDKVRADTSRAHPLEGCSKTTKYTLYVL